MKAAPFPWSFYGPVPSVIDASGREVVSRHWSRAGEETDDDTREYMRLIAAAPDLLALARYADKRGEGDAEMAREILRRLGEPLYGDES